MATSNSGRSTATSPTNSTTTSDIHNDQDFDDGMLIVSMNDQRFRQSLAVTDAKIIFETEPYEVIGEALVLFNYDDEDDDQFQATKGDIGELVVICCARFLLHEKTLTKRNVLCSVWRAPTHS
jgi:hypothetical protein